MADYPFRITPALLDVLEVLADGGEIHGFAIARTAKRPTGSVYPILARLEEAAWVHSRREAQHPQPSRPARRFYQLTEPGLEGAARVLRERRGQARSVRSP